jgi:DNA-binding MarR family transcriptional regulator
MSHPPSPDVLRKVRKLALLPDEARQSRWAVAVTRLTTLKSLCREPEVANRFVTYLARKTLERVRQGKGRSAHPETAKDLAHRQLMADALTEMGAWPRAPSEARRERLRDLLRRMRREQNEYKKIAWGAVRLIDDWDLLLFENALHCLLHPPREAGYWVYQTARIYAERSDASHGTGLTPASAPLVQDIADFWAQELGLDLEKIKAPARTRQAKEGKRATSKTGKVSSARSRKVRFTPRQGQFLAFIHLYRKLHRQGPAETDMVQYFLVTPPSAHGMVVKLEELGLVTRQRGVPRSVRLAVPDKGVPDLEEVKGPPW